VIVMLSFTNRLAVPVELLNNMGTGQLVPSGETLEMTFDLQDNKDGVGDLVLICEPGRVT
jgi:hypothetical protein